VTPARRRRETIGRAATPPLEDAMPLILALIVLVIVIIVAAVIMSGRVRRSQRQGSIAERMTGTGPGERTGRAP
jgi:hypothetical protein